MRSALSGDQVSLINLLCAWNLENAGIEKGTNMFSPKVQVGQVSVRKVSAQEDGVLSAIIAIQSQFEIVKKLMEQNEKISPTGFLISAYKADDLKRFFDDGGQIYVAETNPERRVVGYLLTNPGSNVVKSLAQTRLQWLDQAVEAQYRHQYEAGAFAYLDQVGIDLNFHGSGVSRLLLKAFENDLTENLVLAAVVKEPVFNERSHHFFERMGYQSLGYFLTARLKGLENVKSTIFAKTFARRAQARSE